MFVTLLYFFYALNLEVIGLKKIYIYIFVFLIHLLSHKRVYGKWS